MRVKLKVNALTDKCGILCNVIVNYLLYCGLKLVLVSVELYNSCVEFSTFFSWVEVSAVRRTADHYCTFTLEIYILGSVLFIAL